MGNAEIVQKNLMALKATEFLHGMNIIYIGVAFLFLLVTLSLIKKITSLMIKVIVVAVALTLVIAYIVTSQYTSL